MSDDLVKRYDLQQPTHHMGSAEMVCDTYGDWVLYRDYKALLDLSSVSLCNLHREYDKRGDRIEELERERDKAMKWAQEQHLAADRYAARVKALEGENARLRKDIGKKQWRMNGNMEGWQ
jgi:predicted nuclease with TOPRIM domain